MKTGGYGKAADAGNTLTFKTTIMKKYFILIFSGYLIAAFQNDLNAQTNTDSVTANERQRDFGKRRYHLHLIKKPHRKPGSYFRVHLNSNGTSDTTDLIEVLNKETGFITITTQLKEQNAIVDFGNGNIILDGLADNGAIIEYPIVAKVKNGAAFKSVIVFIDSLGNITPAYKDAVAAYKEPPEQSTAKVAICGLWSSWTTVSLGSCRLHPNCPRNVYGAKLANQQRTRRCTNGQTQKESRTVFVGCNCYT